MITTELPDVARTVNIGDDTLGNPNLVSVTDPLLDATSTYSYTSPGEIGANTATTLSTLFRRYCLPHAQRREFRHLQPRHGGK